MPPTLLFDRSDRARIEITGAQAVATLNGLVTNDVSVLKPGQGEYAAALTARGKIIADTRILMTDRGLLLDTSASAAAGLRTMLSKYVNPRFATQVDVSDGTAELALVGPGSAGLIASVSGVPVESLDALQLHHHAAGCVGSAPVTIVRAVSLGVDLWDAFDLLLSREAVAEVAEVLTSHGAVPTAPREWDVLRVEAGLPEWGVDMDDTTLLQEANLEDLHAVSYTKGCYVGQETVARVHFRGHVNRTLRRLSFTGDGIPPSGATLTDSDAKVVGDVRSTARSRAAGVGVIGIGMVRREIPDGATLNVRWEARAEGDGVAGAGFRQQSGAAEAGGTEAVVAGKAGGAVE